MKVNRIMTAHAHCVAPDNTLVEAAGLMRELDVGSLPVCETGRVSGMVTDRDIVLRGVARGLDANTATVSDVMSSGVICVFADQDVEDAARLMEEKQIRRLPVLDRGKQLVGIVSLGDLAVSSNPAFSGIALKEVSQTPQEHVRDQTPRMVVRQTGTRSRSGNGSTPRGTRASNRGTSRRKNSTSSRRSGRGTTQTVGRKRNAGRRGGSMRSRTSGKRRATTGRSR